MEKSKKRILLVEDETHLLDVIKLNLEIEGYEVVPAITGGEAISKYNQNKIDLILLDIMLPEVDGFTVCQTIRLKDSKVPIIILTAKNTGTDRVKGLKIGADDYLTKPFNLEELLLRVQKLLKRIEVHENPKLENIISIGRSKVDFSSFEIIDNKGKHIQLSDRESKLLKLLVERNGEVVSREEILETVWGYNVYPSTRTIDNYILSFRKYFERNPKNPKYFHSVRGVGYKYTG